MLDHFAADVEIGDAVAYPLSTDNGLTLGYLRIFEISDAELIGVDLAGQPARLPASTPFAAVRGLDEPKRRRPVRYR